MAEIIERLKDLNYWWDGDYKIAFKERAIYKEIKKYIDLPQIIAFTGLRRVGKTTLMLKIISDVIYDGINPRNIIYFSFDEFKTIEIRDLMREYEKITEKDFRREKYFLFLDEIQKLNNWEEQLKAIYDTFGKNIKIIISGSESLFIRKKSKETLAGRIFEFKIGLLSFKEFLSFKDVFFEPVKLYEKELSRIFNEFILTNGFPELVGVTDKGVIKKYIQESIIEKVIYRDMTELYKIRDISVISSLVNMFLEQPGQLVDLSAMSSDLKISRQTLSNYLTYLEDSFLVRKLYNYSRGRRKVERKLRKYYPSIVSPEFMFREDEFSKPRVFESIVVNQLEAEFFWRDSYKNEVDIVIANDKTVPVEVKYGGLDFKGIVAFMEKFGVNVGYIITPDREEEKKIDGKTVYVVPAYKYFLEKKDAL